jgi:hypothetical protein
VRTSSVEIFSDETNAPVMRHPGRRFPGVLVQGDSLHSLHSDLNRVIRSAGSSLPGDDLDELSDIRDRVGAYLEHYKAVLRQHGLELPFDEAPDV